MKARAPRTTASALGSTIIALENAGVLRRVSHGSDSVHPGNTVLTRSLNTGRRRHPGCRCTPYHVSPGLPEKRMTCGTDKCPCFRAGRECDPESCGDCGAREEVEMATRPEEERVSEQSEGQRWFPGKCRNVGLRSGEFQPVRVDYSSIHGYGLFAKVDIPNNTLIIGQYSRASIGVSLMR